MRGDSEHREDREDGSKGEAASVCSARKKGEKEISEERPTRIASHREGEIEDGLVALGDDVDCYGGEAEDDGPENDQEPRALERLRRVTPVAEEALRRLGERSDDGVEA